MRYTIESSELIVEIESKGAELKSIKSKENGGEYMWSADPNFWGKSSPILFPFVGTVRDGKYRFDGKEYAISRHGFARDMEFELAEKDADSIVFSLEDNEDTLTKYPFKFRLEIKYSVVGKNLNVSWNVKNKNDDTMYFSIGGHPAFACPPHYASDAKRTDCFIRYDSKKNLESHYLDGPSGLVTDEHRKYVLNDGIMEITENLFDDDALIFENDQAHVIELLDPDKKPYVKVTFKAPLYGIWSYPDVNAGFVCIEPWYGRCDAQDYDGDLTEREFGNEIEAYGEFFADYDITIL